MKPVANLLLALIGSFVVFLTTSQAQVAYTGGYIEDFNTLPSVGNLTGGYAPWTNNSTLTGWYAAYEIGTFQGIGPTSGTGTVAALKSFGSGSSDAERALGSIAGDATGKIFYGIRLTNMTSETITQLDISYDGETWRQGFTTAAVYQKLSFSYSLNATGIPDTLFGTSNSFSDLDFTTELPTLMAPATTGAAANGNNNAIFIGSILTIQSGWAPGTDLWLRWTDINDAGGDSGLGIDNLLITTAASVPEPGTIALAAIGGTWVLLFARRRRSAATR